MRLDGKIALLLRYEPLNESGRSRWGDGRWSTRASFQNKLAAVERLGASAAVIVNPPGVAGLRGAELLQPGRGVRAYVNIPVLHLSRAAGERLVAAADPEARSLMDLRKRSDAGGFAVELKSTASLEARFVTEPFHVENLVGVLPGRGALAAEHVVVGAHIDHLGRGRGAGGRGARSVQVADAASEGVVYPGADDNASGVAGMLLVAARLADEYRAAPPDAELRTVAFIAFNAEESGAIGSRYYVANPLAPLTQHALMVNLSSIGRIERSRLHLQGLASGTGLAEFVAPLLEASSLDVLAGLRFTGVGDHTPFQRAEVPVLHAFGDRHADQRTPRDTADKVNVCEALAAVDLLHGIVGAVAAWPQRFEFEPRTPR
ncbi:MAG: M28 family peptidase [Planctomycetota bacterium]